MSFCWPSFLLSVFLSFIRDVLMLSVILLSVIMLSVIMLSVVILYAPLLSNIMQSLVYAECFFAECRFTDCCGTLQSVRVVVKFVVKKKKRINVILSVFQCLLNVFLFIGRLKHLRGNGICQDCLKFLVGYAVTLNHYPRVSYCVRVPDKIPH